MIFIDVGYGWWREVPGLLNNASLHVVTVHYGCLPSGISANVFDSYKVLTNIASQL